MDGLMSEVLWRLLVAGKKYGDRSRIPYRGPRDVKSVPL